MAKNDYRGDVDILDEILWELRRHNKYIETSDDRQYDYHHNKIEAHHTSHDMRGHSGIRPKIDSSTPAILQKIVGEEYLPSPYEKKEHADEVEQVQRIVKAFSVSISNTLEKIDKKFVNILKKVSNTEKNVDADNKNIPLLEQEGFSSAIRRGMLDIYGQSEKKGIKESLGKGLGKFLSLAGGVSMSRRRMYARESIDREQEYKRAISEDPYKLLPHEEHELQKEAERYDAGDIDNGLTKDEHLEKIKKTLIAKHNLEAVKAKDVNFNPELQREWGVQAEIKEAYHSPKILERAKSSDIDAQYALEPHEQDKIKELKRDLESGKIDTKGIPHSVYLQQEEQLLPLQNNLKAIQMYSPEYGAGQGGLQEKLKKEIEGIENQRNKTHISPKVIDPTHHKDFLRKKDEILHVKEPKKNVVESFGNFIGGSNKSNSIKLDKIELKDAVLDNLTVKALTIQSLMLPESQKENSTPQSTENNGSTSLGGVAEGVMDFTRSRSGGITSKMGGLKKIGGAAMRMAIPAAVAYAGGSLIDSGMGAFGVGNDVPDLNQDDENWNKMSTMQKVGSSIPRAIESVGNLFGLGNMTRQATADRIAKETKMVAPELITKGNDVNPIPDQKQVELSSVKYENEQLLQAERDASIQKNGGSNIVISAPTQVTTHSNQQSITAVRPSFSAYERFVDRTFTTL